VKINIFMTTINKTLESSKIEILRDPDFTLKSKYQHLKLWCMANKTYQNKKNLYACFTISPKGRTVRATLSLCDVTNGTIGKQGSVV